MKHLLTLLILSLLALFASPVQAQTHEWSLLPKLSPYVKTGLGAYRAQACPCFDRGTWSVDMGLNLQWSRFVGLEGEYRFGSMLLGGNFPFTGYALGLRSGLTPTPKRWWDDFYLRAGWGYIAIMGTRDPGYHGLYLSPGWALRLYGPLHLEGEVSTSYYFGAMEHLNLGFRSGLRVTF